MMNRAPLGLMGDLLLLTALMLAPTVVRAQEPGQAKSSPAAVSQYRDAVAFQNRGIYDLAADEWQKFLENFAADPLAGKAQHYLGVCRLQLKQYDQVIASFKVGIEKRPDQELLPTTYLNLGLAQYSGAQAGKKELYRAAADTFTTLEKKFPKNEAVPQAVFYAAEALYGGGDKEQASALYTRYLKENPTGSLRPDAVYALGVTQEELGKATEAAAQYDSFLKEFADHRLRAEVIMRRAETLFAAKQFKPAAQWFDSAARHPNFALADYALLRKGATQYEQKDYAKAAATYASLIEKYPNSSHAAAARLAAGNCYYLSGEFAEANRHLKPVISAGGEPAVEAAHWIARALIKQRHPDKALKLAERMSAKAGQAPFAPNLLMDRADAAYELDP